MTAIPRQKACIACAESKRRCDKQLPECQRCLDRAVDCAYPQPRKRRRTDDPTRPRQPKNMQALERYDTRTNSLDLEGWPMIVGPSNDNSFSNGISPFAPISPSLGAGLPEHGIILESESVSDTLTPWFLQDETWNLQHSEEKAACATYVELEPFIRSVENMLKAWVKDGFNSFIHRRLYRLGMPHYLQDAFTTLATYISCTVTVKDFILQIAEDRLSALVNQGPYPTGQGAHGIQAHLARVQALFIYEFIVLFDGSVRARASGDRHLPVLRKWVTQMRETVRGYRGQDGLLDQNSYQWDVSEFNREYNISSELWNQWILTESIRRTQVIVNTISNTYEMMVVGSAECTGAVMFTARRGLWEAESAFQWFELSCSKLPLLVPSLRPSSLMSQYNADEIDDFVKLFWTFLVGNDRIQCWIDKTEHRNRI